MTTTVPFMAFQNESESFDIGGLTVENRFDRVSIHGSCNITKDQAGLRRAHLLKRLIDSTIYELKRDINLPENIDAEMPESVKNPF